MAVYKSTHCYPFMNSIDIRVARTDTDNAIPVQYLKCKVNTSNKNITGYKIRVLDSNNNQIFPFDGENIVSPLIELQIGKMASLYESNGLNSGINGTYLQIPFFQCLGQQKTVSYNAVYYKPKYAADYVVMDDALADEILGSTAVLAMDADNWSVAESGNLKYNWPQNSGEVDVVDQATSQEAFADTDSNSVYYYDGTYNPAYDYDELRNRIRIDSETLLEGQIILIARKTSAGLSPSSSHNGFYRVTKVIRTINGRPTIQTELVPLNAYGWTLSNEDCIVIKRGESAHNVVLQYSSATDGFSAYTGDLYYKYDESGTLSPLEGFDVHGSLLKWEITLYQGEDGKVQGTPKRITYGNIDPRYLDMTVSAGNVLGSNSSRIQIAREQAFMGGSSIPNSNAIIPRAKNGTLVLQGRYADLSSFTSSPQIFRGNRIYVQTYDATYGHVYPQDGALDALAVNSATHVQFFKYTNDPDAIKSQDIVDFGIGYNITFIYYRYDEPGPGGDEGSYTEVTEEEFNKLSIAKRVYGVYKTSLPLAFQSLIENGSKIIFTGQGQDFNNHAYQNGVYEISFINTPDANLIFALKRASGYTNWGSYIGKIIYCSNYNEELNGSIVSRNIESLADAGSANTLWNPSDINGSIIASTTGSGVRASYLYFTNEMPVLLFEELVSDDRYYDLFFEGGKDDYVTGGLIDGVIPVEYSIVLTSEGDDGHPKPYVYQNRDLQEISDPEKRERLTPISGQNEYCYFARGAKWGKRIWQTGKGFNPDWSLYTATILKNSSNYTYISPFDNVENTMKLKLTGGNTVTIPTSTGNVQTSWLSIKGVNTNLFCIAHDTLVSPLVLESEYSSKSNTPWHYEIKSYFRKSDENPFYCYENPYLLLYKNNNDYTTLANLKIDKEFWVRKQGGSEPYWVTNNGGSQFIVMEVQDASVIYGKSVKLSAQYIQFDGLSWESYRWTLSNSKGETLQDTGRRYDKSMSVIFYGLSNDNEDTYSTYYATLYVEDEHENVLTYIIKLIVKAGETIQNYFPFTAEFDCDSHAVKLEYIANGKFTSTYRDNYGYDISVLEHANNGAVYSNGDNVSIYNLDKQGNPDLSGNPVVYYNSGSKIDSSDRELYYPRMSIENNLGLPYYTFIDDSQGQHVGSEHDSFAIQKLADDIENNGQLYFETDIQLDDNYCGDILSFEVEGVSGEAIEMPYYKEDGSMNDIVGYILFNFKTQDNFEGGYLNPARNLINFTIATTDGYNIISKSIDLNKIPLFDIENVSSKYYLQPASVIAGGSEYKTSKYEYLRYDLYESTTAPSLYLTKDKNGEFFCGGGRFLGNLCLSRQDSADNYLYWEETRPILNDPVGSDKILGNKRVQFLRNIDKTEGTDDGRQKWPISDENFYWKEGNYSSNDPILWENLSANNGNIIKVVPLSRHYGVSDYDYHFICRFNNITDLYNSLLHNYLVLEEVEEITGDENRKVSIINFKAGSAIIGTIKIEKYKD